MSTKEQRSEAASILGERGRKQRWSNTTKAERARFARRLAAARWPSFAKVLQEEPRSSTPAPRREA
jgi:hypothetical protein